MRQGAIRGEEEPLKKGMYIYCVIQCGERRSFGPIGIGGNGDEVYTVPYRDISAVVSKTVTRKWGVSRENVMPHERVIEEVMRTHTVLPVRFATMTDDEGKVRHALGRDYERFLDLLSYMDGKKELGVKTMFKNNTVYRDILQKHDDIRLLKKRIVGLSPGKALCQRMEIRGMVEVAIEKERESCREAMLAALTPLSIEVKTNKVYGEQMILNAAFLVEKETENAFQNAVEGLAGKYGERVRFKYAGPLPPFNFVNLVIRTEKNRAISECL
jgi:hypothetical protein